MKNTLVKPLIAFIGFSLIGIAGGLFFSKHDPFANAIIITDETVHSLGVWLGILLIPIPILWIFGRIEKWVGHTTISAILDMITSFLIVGIFILFIIRFAVR